MSINTCINCGRKYCVNDTYACSCGEVKVVEQAPVATVTQVYIEKIMYENERYKELLKNLKEAIKTDCVECGGCHIEPVTCPISELDRAVREMD